MTEHISAEVPAAASPGPQRAVAQISKKRWAEACGALREELGDTPATQAAINRLQTIFRFNPDLPAYTPEQAERMVEWRRKKAEATGQSIWVVSGGKRAYDKKRSVVRAAQASPPAATPDSGGQTATAGDSEA